MPNTSQAAAHCSTISASLLRKTSCAEPYELFRGETQTDSSPSVLVHDGRNWQPQGTPALRTRHLPCRRSSTHALLGWTDSDKQDDEAVYRSDSVPLNARCLSSDCEQPVALQKICRASTTALDGNTGPPRVPSSDALEAVAASWHKTGHVLSQTSPKPGATAGVLASGRMVRRASRVQIVSDLGDAYVRPRYSSIEGPDKAGLQRLQPGTSHSERLAKCQAGLCSIEHQDARVESCMLPDINARSASKPRPKPRAQASWSNFQTEVLVGLPQHQARRGSQVYYIQDSLINEEVPASPSNSAGRLPKRNPPHDPTAMWNMMQPAPPLLPLASAAKPSLQHRRLSSVMYDGSSSTPLFTNSNTQLHGGSNSLLSKSSTLQGPMPGEVSGLEDWMVTVAIADDDY